MMFRPNSQEEHGEVSRDIFRFLSEVIGENTRVVRTLKACNHGIIAPSILQLRKNICPHLMFKGTLNLKIVDYSLVKQLKKNKLAKNNNLKK